MPTDPASIPEHVMKAFSQGTVDAHNHDDPYRVGLAYALDALMVGHMTMVSPLPFLVEIDLPAVLAAALEEARA